MSESCVGVLAHGSSCRLAVETSCKVVAPGLVEAEGAGSHWAANAGVEVLLWGCLLD